MARICRFKDLPPAFDVKLGDGKTMRLGSCYGAMGQDHPTISNYIWVDWLDSDLKVTGGFYPKWSLQFVGIDGIGPEPGLQPGREPVS